MSHKINEVVALIIIDMQAGLFTSETPRYDSDGVVNRINELSRVVRKSNGIVIFIQHNGPKGGSFEPGTKTWQLLTSLERYPGDIIISKMACDSFYNTELKKVLDQNKIKQLIITGCATDFCVDTTIRAAISHDYEVIVASDGHTTADRANIDAPTLIEYHNWLWQNLIHPKIHIEVMKTSDLIGTF
jgi:nicotinamidase-related amidase